MPAFKEVRDLPFSLTRDGSAPRPSPLWGRVPARMTMEELADAADSLESAVKGEMEGAVWGEATYHPGCAFAYFPLAGNPVPQVLISVAEALRIGPRKVARAIRAASEGRDPWEELG